jgi:hypothetical protein
MPGRDASRRKRLPFDVDLTPAEYERAVHQLAACWVEKHPGSTAKFDEVLRCGDGSYQMDVVLRIRLPPPAGLLIILVDAKRRSRVERSDLQELHAKINSCGAHKGVVVTTGHFQRGALEYGRHHGIGMIQFRDQSIREFRSRSAKSETPARPVPAWVEPGERGTRYFMPRELGELLDVLLAAGKPAFHS